MTRFNKEEARRAEMVAREYGGIFPPYEGFYLQSIKYAAQRSEAGFSSFWAALSAGDSGESVFAAIQDAFGHAAALSRFFWPTPQAGTLGLARGKRLRHAFALAEDAALSSRAFRNAIEHLDERIDHFLLRDPVGCFFPEPLVADHTIADEPMGHIFKLVDPDLSMCVILGEKFSFASIEIEVRQVHRIARKFLSEGSAMPR